MMELPPPVRERDAPKSSSLHDPEYLRSQSRWIRDELDPLVAREGPDALSSDDLLNLDDFLRRLVDIRIDRSDVRFSRMHCAILGITGRGTRWPKKIIDRCVAVEAVWQAKFGPLKAIGFPLIDAGGRSYGPRNSGDLLDWEKPSWKRPSILRPGLTAANKIGDLGFKPGDWWINASFAYRDGIIDDEAHEGSITADANGAYAVLMAGNDEVDGPTPDSFTYRARDVGRGRYRLTAGTPESRNPVRVVRSHTLRSFWAPRVGVRFNGLYKVTGWSIKTNKGTKSVDHHIYFERLQGQISSDVVMRRPFVDEVEDYVAYKNAKRTEKRK